MGYEEALLGRDYRREQKSLQRKAKKKGLWGSVGRTLGGLVAAAFTGGTVNPVTLGLITGAGTLAGGALGAKASGVGSLKGGTFMKEDRASLERQLGAFGEANITGALKSGLTAGIGQSVKLAKAGTAARAGGATAEEAAKITKGVSFKEGFGESFVGKGIAKGKAAKEAAKELSTMRGFQGQYESLQAAKAAKVTKAATAAGQKASLDDFLTGKADFASEFGAGGGDPRGLQRMAVAKDVPEFTTQMPIDPSFEYGQQGGRTTASMQIPAYGQGTFYEKKFKFGNPIY